MSRLTESLSPDGATHPARAARRTPVVSDVGIGIACAALGAIGFSGKAIIVKLGYRYGADPISMLVLRMGLAFPFFAILAVVASRRRAAASLSNGDRLKILVLGFLGYYLASFLDFLGLEYVSASLERLILYLNPTLVLLIGLMFFRRRINPRQIVALLVGYSGVVLAFAHDLHLGGGNIAIGGLLVFASAISYAIYLVVSGELVQRVGTLRLTAYASCVAALCCVVHFAVTRPIALLATLPAPVYGLSMLNATLCTVLPVFAVMIGVRRLGAGVASQVGMVGPVSTIVLADLFLDEKMGLVQVIGTALVLIGVFIVSQAGAGRATPAISNR